MTLYFLAICRKTYRLRVRLTMADEDGRLGQGVFTAFRIVDRERYQLVYGKDLKNAGDGDYEMYRRGFLDRWFGRN